ncbi:MAG: hypothetical protein QW666_01240 [Candidatus Woesearchaeota archaeon]
MVQLVRVYGALVKNSSRTENSIEDLKAKLAKYETLGTPEELKKALEQAKEGEELNKRLEDLEKAFREHKPKFPKLAQIDDLKKLFE